MAWFLSKGFEDGAYLNYQIKKGLFEVKDKHHIAMLQDDPRFQLLTSDQVAKAKETLATDSGVVKKELEEKPAEKVNVVEESVEKDIENIPESNLESNAENVKKIKKGRKKVKKEE